MILAQTIANVVMKGLLIGSFVTLESNHYFAWALLLVLSAVCESVEKELYCEMRR